MARDNSYLGGKADTSEARLLDSDGPGAAAHMAGPISFVIDFVVWPRPGEEPDGWTGSTIAVGVHEETGEPIDLKGQFGPVEVGDAIQVLDRKWERSQRYGEQLIVWKSRRDMTSRAGIVAYLKSLPGVGPVMANRIVETLGANCLQRIDADPHILMTVKTPSGYGIRATQMEELVVVWPEHAVQRSSMVYLHSLEGLGDAAVKRILSHFGADAEAIVKDNPYRLMAVPGMKFGQVDRVARELKIDATDPRRLGAGVSYVIERAEGDGHICLTREEIFSRSPEVLRRDGVTPNDKELAQAIEEMLEEGWLHSETDPDSGVEQVYTMDNFIIETRLYENLRNRLRTNPYEAPEDLVKPEESILTDEQWKAVEASFTEPISILTGGPGTGKTTALKELIQEQKHRGNAVICMAPTGKAAKRMTEATGEDAFTIHRVLGFDGRAAPVDIAQGSDVNEGRGIDADVVIVDESSMLDMKLAERLTSNLNPDCRLVLVGDPDQLPSVGAGSVLLDLLDSDRVPTTRLTKVQRQAEGSLITVNAHRVRQGLEPFYSATEAEAELGHPVNEDFYFVEAGSDTKTLKLMLKMHEAAPSRLGIDLDSVMLLSPQRKGDAGVWMLNRVVQHRRNPAGEQVRTGDEPLRVGDRIINTKNRYGANGSEPDVMNGDMGEILSWEKRTKTCHVSIDGEMQRVSFSGKDLDALKPGYALTVHKSQGSEAPMVIMSVLPSRMLSRNLIYTAMTRAREVVVMVGSKNALRTALKIDGSRRNTTLDMRVARVEERIASRTERLVEVREMHRLRGAALNQALREMLVVDNDRHTAEFLADQDADSAEAPVEEAAPQDPGHSPFGSRLGDIA